MNRTRRLILIGCIGAWALSCGFAGVITTGNSIDFTAADLATGTGTATKNWAIYDAASANNTPVWAQSGLFFQNNGLAMSYSTGTTAYVTWKVTVPANLSITSFRWKARQVILNGSNTGDDQFAWHYSTDGSNWTSFYARANRASTDTGVVYVNNQDILQNVSQTGISTIYIRASLVEGTSVTGDSGYFAVVSNPATGGGENAASTITLTATENITVDATVPDNATRGDDLKVIKGYFDSATYQKFGTQTAMTKLKNEVGLVGLRGINVADRGSLYDLATGIFTPGTSTYGGLTEYLTTVRQNNMRPHVVVGQSTSSIDDPNSNDPNVKLTTYPVPPVTANPSLDASFSNWGALPNTYPDYRNAGAVNWANYQKFALALIHHVETNSHLGAIVADDFYDQGLSANPAWSPTDNIGASPNWRVENGNLVFSTDPDATGAKRVLGISGLTIPTTKPTYVTFDIRVPQAITADFKPVSFSLVNTTSGSGYSLYACPAVGYGPDGAKSGFGSSPYGNNVNAVGPIGDHLANSGTWNNICIKFDPVGHTITLSYNGKPEITITGVPTGFTFNRFELKNITGAPNPIAYQLRNLLIADCPGDPIGDNFNDNQLTQSIDGPDWLVTQDGGTGAGERLWNVVNQRLVCASKTPGPNNTATPTIGINLFPAETNNQINISFQVRHPDETLAFTPLKFSISDSGAGYSIYAAPTTGYNGTGFYGAPYGSNPSYAGEPNETLVSGGGQTHNKWETIVISFDPVADKVTMTRDGRVVLTIPNATTISKVSKFEITNAGYYQRAWEIDNVYAWYGTEPMPEVLFEVENEPDIMTRAWWAGSQGVGEIPDANVTTLAKGGTDLYNKYMQMFKLWSGAVELASRDIKRPLRIGGPSGSPYTTYYGTGSIGGYGQGQSWMEKMAADCASGSIRFDDMTLHNYGDFSSLWDRDLTNPGVYKNLTEQLQDVRTGLSSATNNYWTDNTRLNITEWGPDMAVVSANFTYDVDADGNPIGFPRSEKNTTNVGAAWTAAFLHNLIETGVEKAVFLSTHDLQGSSPNNWGFVAFLSTNAQYVKPTFNIARMVSLMKGSRISLNDTALSVYSDLGGLASAELNLPGGTGESVGILVYNYDWKYNIIPSSGEMSVATPVSLKVTLPSAWNGITPTVTKYTIDATHSNIYKWIKDGLTTTPNVSGNLESESVTGINAVSGNSLTLPTTVLQPSSVTLWMITR